MQQSLAGLAQYSANLQNAHRNTSSEATAAAVRAQVFRASLVSNPLGEPVKLEVDVARTRSPSK